jgi:hypothetical protein
VVSFACMWSVDQDLASGVGHWHPHVMVFAPHYDNSMVGGNTFGSPLPTLSDAGTRFAVVAIPSSLHPRTPRICPGKPERYTCTGPISFFSPTPLNQAGYERGHKSALSINREETPMDADIKTAVAPCTKDSSRNLAKPCLNTTSIWNGTTSCAIFRRSMTRLITVFGIMLAIASSVSSL